MRTVREGSDLGGRYRLERPLGRGSMARVWQGRDLHLGRPVAVKTIILDSDAPAGDGEHARLQRRFERPTAVAAGHLHEPPPALAEYGVHAPEGLQRLLSSLLAKDRKDRPARAADVYEALGPWLPVPSAGHTDLRAFGAEDPRRPFVLPQSPYLM